MNRQLLVNDLDIITLAHPSYGGTEGSGPMLKVSFEKGVRAHVERGSGPNPDCIVVSQYVTRLQIWTTRLGRVNTMKTRSENVALSTTLHMPLIHMNDLRSVYARLYETKLF